MVNLEIVDKAKTCNAVGRRKTSIAKVQLSFGNGRLVINGLPGEKYLQYNPEYINTVSTPLNISSLNSSYDINVSVLGGGLAAQTDAISLGIARALCQASADLRPILKTLGLLTRDDRKKERKKFGLKKARKAPQFSKR